MVLRVGDRVRFDAVAQMVAALSGTLVRLADEQGRTSVVHLPHLLATDGFEHLGERVAAPALPPGLLHAVPAASQLASSVTSSVTKPAVAPDSRIAAAVCWPPSSRMSPIMIEAPERASASAIPAPRPRAPPVTSALRPVSSYALIRRSSVLSSPMHASWPRRRDVRYRTQ